MKQLKLTVNVIENYDHLALKLPDAARKQAQEIMEFCKEKRGGFVSFCIGPPRRPRSTGKGSQSHHLNGHVQQIATETGQPFDDVKKHVKQLAIDQGYPFITKPDGSPQLDLWGNMQGISEADSTVEQCKILIDTVHMFAAEFDIRLQEE